MRFAGGPDEREPTGRPLHGGIDAVSKCTGPVVRDVPVDRRQAWPAARQYRAACAAAVLARRCAGRPGDGDPRACPPARRRAAVRPGAPVGGAPVPVPDTVRARRRPRVPRAGPHTARAQARARVGPSAASPGRARRLRWPRRDRSGHGRRPVGGPSRGRDVRRAPRQSGGATSGRARRPQRVRHGHAAVRSGPRTGVGGSHATAFGVGCAKPFPVLPMARELFVLTDHNDRARTE